jgi:hypothetical protein
MKNRTAPIELVADTTGLAPDWTGQERRAALRVALLTQ